MKSSNKDKLMLFSAVVMVTAFLALVTYSIGVNFDIFKSTDSNNDDTEDAGSILPSFGTQDVTNENKDKKIVVRNNSVSFSDDYLVIRKTSTDDDDRFDCAFSETNCLFYELQNISTGVSYYISDTTPIVLAEKPVFSSDKNDQLEIKGEMVDVINEVITTIPDDPSVEGPNLELAIEETQEMYGCIPNSAICFSSGLITLVDNQKQIDSFQSFLNNLKYE